MVIFYLLLIALPYYLVALILYIFLKSKLFKGNKKRVFVSILCISVILYIFFRTFRDAKFTFNISLDDETLWTMVLNFIIISIPYFLIFRSALKNKEPL